MEDSNVSDQDFFFDEDEQPKADAPKASGSKKGSSSSKAAASAPAAQSNSMTVTILVGVIAALLGVIIGIFVGRSLAAPAVVAPTTGAIQGGTTTEQAPQLTPEQLEGGELPKGHPDIGGANPDGSTETTAK